MKVPAFLLRRLYVHGSLNNTETGWAFTLHNSMAGGEAVGLEPLVIDGTRLELEDCFFTHEDRLVSFDRVDDENRFGLESGRDIVVSVAGSALASGAHTVEMAFTVPGIGRLAFDFTDQVP